MTTGDLELARRLHEAMGSGLDAVCALLCDDAEYVTDRRTLRGLAEIREKLSGGSGETLENLDREFSGGEWELEDGVAVCRSRVVLRWKETGEVATSTDVYEAVTVRGGKIARYERRVKWE